MDASPLIQELGQFCTRSPGYRELMQKYIHSHLLPYRVTIVCNDGPADPTPDTPDTPDDE